jgi:DNA-directed RNA polymerase specialized sigma24 family protein
MIQKPIRQVVPIVYTGEAPVYSEQSPYVNGLEEQAEKLANKCSNLLTSFQTSVIIDRLLYKKSFNEIAYSLKSSKRKAQLEYYSAMKTLKERYAEETTK